MKEYGCDGISFDYIPIRASQIKYTAIFGKVKGGNAGWEKT